MGGCAVVLPDAQQQQQQGRIARTSADVRLQERGVTRAHHRLAVSPLTYVMTGSFPVIDVVVMGGIRRRSSDHPAHGSSGGSLKVALIIIIPAFGAVFYCSKAQET